MNLRMNLMKSETITMNELSDKVAVVTGASSGIGKETAVRLGEAKARVALLARREERLNGVAEQIRQKGGEALVLKTDVTDETQVKNAVEKTVDAWEKIDILVSVAGLGVFKPIEQLKLTDWNKQIDVMLTGTFLVCHHALPLIYKQNSGRVLFVTSLWGPTKTAADCSAYNAAKAGVSAFAKSLREEIKEKSANVGVTEVRPGTVATEFFDKAEYKGELDPKRVLSAGDVGKAIFDALTARDAIASNVIELEGNNPPY